MRHLLTDPPERNLAFVSAAGMTVITIVGPTAALLAPPVGFRLSEWLLSVVFAEFGSLAVPHMVPEATRHGRQAPGDR